MLEKYFELKKHGTTVRTELIAGLTTFLTMAYIIFVNPDILANAGMPKDGVFVATCVAAAVGTLIMGLYARFPIALAPGMGLNAFFAFVVVGAMQFTWQQGLAIVLTSGVIFLILSILPVREWIINAIPRSIKLAIAAGIGLFLAFIGLQQAGVVVDHPATLVSIGDFTQPTTYLASLGFVAAVILAFLRIPGSLIIAILLVAVLGMIMGLSQFQGVVALPPDPTPTLLAFDFNGVFEIGAISVIFAFLMVDMFDTAGTLSGLAIRANMLDKEGKLPGMKRGLIADSTATIVGSGLGTSTTTSYIESMAGINAGGRTGLTAVTVAVLFLASLFIAPLATSIPGYATAPALVFVACLMARGIADIEWDDITEVAPALLTAIAMPLTFRIADAIGMGFIAYAVIKLLTGRHADASPAVYVIAIAFLVKFIVLPG